MRCPNCDHKLDDRLLSSLKLHETKIKLTASCDQCRKLVHFVVNSSGNEDEIKCYAWIDEKEKRYAKMISSLKSKRYILLIQPGVSRGDLLSALRQFGVSHGGRTAFIFPESLSDMAGQISSSYETLLLPDSLFPETPSYLAEKLVVENTEGELFSIGETLYNRFQKL